MPGGGRPKRGAPRSDGANSRHDQCVGGLQNNDLEQFLRERLASAHAALENIDEARFMADPTAAIDHVCAEFALEPLGVPRRGELSESRPGDALVQTADGESHHRPRVVVDISVTGPHFLWNYRPADSPPFHASVHGVISHHLFRAGPLFVLTISGDRLRGDDVDAAITATLTQLTTVADRINTATRRWHIELRANLDASARQRQAGRDSRQEFLEHLRRQHL